MLRPMIVGIGPRTGRGVFHMLRLPGSIAAVLVVCVAVTVASAAPVKVGELAGRVMIQTGGTEAATEVSADTVFSEGSLVTCTPDSRLQMAFPNGSLIGIVGPAEVQLVVAQSQAIQVKLISGLINVARARGCRMLIDTEYPVHMIVEASSGYAEVIPGDLMRFANRGGENVVVHLHGEEERPQKAGELPFIIDLKKLKLVRKPVDPLEGGPDGPASSTGEVLESRDVYRLGRRLVRVYPKDKVRVERMTDGGIQITGAGLGNNEFARVEVGFEAVLYIGEGGRVVVDQYGNVDEFTGGVSFIGRPFDRRSFEYEPVKDAADSSPIRTRAR
jgi:hypothetical protein